jgi:hypothetical protein
MLMAARKLQGIGLVLLVLIFAMMLYPVSLKVAATRSELARINHQIERTRDNIRYLESELAVRASMRQLEQWNADSFGYSAPDASQYLSSEHPNPPQRRSRPRRSPRPKSPSCWRRRKRRCAATARRAWRRRVAANSSR